MKDLIVIIDDESDIREVLKAVLEMQGFNVISAATGKEGIGLFRQNKEKIALILLDIMLPDIDGYQALQVIRKESNIPIIMITAKDRNTDKILGLELGADDYVVKPFDTLELIARIKAVLRRYHIQPTDKNLNYNNVNVDEEKRIVDFKGKIIHFTPTQFELFIFLLNNANQVVTRKEIKETLWKGKELYQWSRAIDVHISHLREKIEEDPENPKILITVPQKGYKLKIS